MLSIENEKLIIKFTKSNCYRDNQFLNKDEYLTNNIGASHNNMKKITIKENDFSTICNLLKVNFDKNNECMLNNFRILKEDINNFINDLHFYTFNHTDWFVANECIKKTIKKFELYTWQEISGILKVSFRDENRKEKVISFGMLDEKHKFVDKKDEKFVFNDVVYSLAFQDISEIEINWKDKILLPKFNKEKFESFVLQRPLVKKYNRKRKEL